MIDCLLPLISLDLRFSSENLIQEFFLELLVLVLLSLSDLVLWDYLRLCLAHVFRLEFEALCGGHVEQLGENLIEVLVAASDVVSTLWLAIVEKLHCFFLLTAVTPEESDTPEEEDGEHILDLESIILATEIIQKLHELTLIIRQIFPWIMSFKGEGKWIKLYSFDLPYIFLFWILNLLCFHDSEDVTVDVHPVEWEEMLELLVSVHLLRLFVGESLPIVAMLVEILQRMLDDRSRC